MSDMKKILKDETDKAKALRLKINKSSDIVEREKAFYTIYEVTSQKDLLANFERDVKIIAFATEKISKASKTKQNKALEQEYTSLLELMLNYSHAIFYLYSKSQINKNLIAYRKIALNHLNAKNVNDAFKLVARLRDYKEQEQEPKEEPLKVLDSDCVALEHINSLKDKLEKDDIDAKTGSKEDKIVYMKIAIIALGTGARIGEIISTFEANPNNTIFDAKYLNRLLKEVQEYQGEREFPERTIRNGIDNLKLALSKKLQKQEEKSYNDSLEKWETAIKEWEQDEKPKKDKGLKFQREPSKPKLSSHCRNINHLNSLYNYCISQ